MDYFLGVDLGSTTSKAVILNQDEEIIGRGLTNTRSNYEAAVKVAEQEALMDTRFTFMEEELRQMVDIPRERIDAIIDRYALLFRYEHFFNNILLLKEYTEQEVLTFPATTRENIGSLLEDIFQELEKTAFAYYQEVGQDKSMFFRDLVGSQYMKLAENSGAYFEILMSIFDKCILMIENHIPEMDVLDLARKALARLIEMGGVSEIQEGIEKAFAVASRRPLDIAVRVGTGYGRMRLPYPKEQIQSEILCHGLGAHYMFPDTRTLLDIGGQDTKAIQVDENGIVTSFHMNDRCAAGCGRFLGYIADELNLGLHELGPLALEARKAAKISSTCTVFSTIEIRDRLSLGERREDIVAGLHKAIMKRAMSLLARSGGIRNEFTFTGGVAKNQAAVKYLREMVFENYGDITINVSPDSIYTGALGAAMFARRRVQ